MFLCPFFIGTMRKCCSRLIWRNFSSLPHRNAAQKNVDKKKLKKDISLAGTSLEENCDVEKIRNVGIIAHIDAGKTTTTERMLYFSGVTRYMGNVDSGDTVTDYMAQERERGITIMSAAIVFKWDEHKINLIDTPGHVDFTLEVERCLRVLDGAVTILDASRGVEAQTLKVWSQAKKFGVPSIIYLNKVDKPNASIDLCLKSIEEKLKVTPVLINAPLTEGKSFRGLTDLVNMKKILWPRNNEDGRSFECQPVEKSADDYRKIQILREKLVGLASDWDGDLSDAFLRANSLDDVPSSLIEGALRRCLLEGADLHNEGKQARRPVTPVLCGSSATKVGVQPLLSAIGKYLPSPLDKRRLFAQLYPEAALCALAFKIVPHPFLGPLTLVRVYNGRLTPNCKVYNVNRDRIELISGVFSPCGDDMREMASVMAGNIAAVSGLTTTITGDTLTTDAKAAQEAKRTFERQRAAGSSDSSSHEVDLTSGDKLILAGIEAPDPVFFCSIESPSLSEQKKFDEALARLTREDPSLRVSVDPDSLQTILRGMGELQIEIIRDRLKTEFGLNVFLGDVQISYKETLQRNIEAKDRHEISDISSGKSHKICIGLKVAQCDGAGWLKSIALDHAKDEHYGFLCNLPDFFREAVKEGCVNACYRGPILGYPVQDIRVTLCEFSATPGANPSLINACAHACLSKIFEKIPGDLLEPLMAVEVHAPEDYARSVLGDLAHRRANIEKSDWCQDSNVRLIKCMAPLAELFGFSKSIRTLTSGTGDVHMQVAGYEPMAAEAVKNLQMKMQGIY